MSVPPVVLPLRMHRSSIDEAPPQEPPSTRPMGEGTCSQAGRCDRACGHTERVARACPSNENLAEGPV